MRSTLQAKQASIIARLERLKEGGGGVIHAGSGLPTHHAPRLAGQHHCQHRRRRQQQQPFFLLLFSAWSKIIVYILFFSRESCCSLAFLSVIKEA